MRLLTRNEKEDLRSRLLDAQLLFKAFQAPVREFEAEAKDFRLSPEEVFWQLVVQLDNIKEHPQDAILDVRHMWNDIYVDYRDISNSDNDETVRLFATLTVLVVQVCLAAIDEPLYKNMAFDLASQLPTANNTFLRMEAAIVNNIARVGTDKFETAIIAYMESDDDWLSEDIDEVLDEVSALQIASTGSEQKGETMSDKSTLRITPRKQTSVIVILEAMYKAGWIEKYDGSKVTNRDDVIKEILVRAFNADKVSPTQILQAAKDSTRNKSGIDKYFDELKDIMDK